jgi:asparagine synthase (glutamine-hydrolysing)
VGEDCVLKLNGIFAFAVWEKHNRRLFIARDRMGVKPFFYALRKRKLSVRVRDQGLLAHPLVKPEIDLNSIAEIMLHRPGRTPGYGVFRRIKELPPACCGFFTESGLNTRVYWSLKDREHKDSFEDTG